MSNFQKIVQITVSGVAFDRFVVVLGNLSKFWSIYPIMYNTEARQENQPVDTRFQRSGIV